MSSHKQGCQCGYVKVRPELTHALREAGEEPGGGEMEAEPPLTLSEKVIYSHLDDPANRDIEG